jgi:hypothetical protein
VLIAAFVRVREHHQAGLDRSCSVLAVRSLTALTLLTTFS